MTPTWHDRQREALRAFKKAAAERARLEQEVEEAFQTGTQANEAEHERRRTQIEEDFRRERAGVDREFEENLTRLQERHDQQRSQLERDMEEAKRGAISDYANAKQALEAEFKDARWTTLAMHEADRKVARSHYADIQHRTKEMLKKLSANVRVAEERLARWRLLEGAPPPEPPDAAVDVEDPRNGLESRLAQSASFLAVMTKARLPGFVKGVWPWITLILVWAVVSLPALVLDWWHWWLLGSTLIVWPLGWAVIRWLRREARRVVWQLHDGVVSAHVDARVLRRRWLDDARTDYRLQRRLSQERSHVALREAARKAREAISAARADRQRRLTQAITTYPPLLKQAHRQRVRDMAALEESVRARVADLEARRSKDLVSAAADMTKRQNDLNRRHAREWTDLATSWQDACERLRFELAAVSAEARPYFPEWGRVRSDDWMPPASLPSGLPYGRYAVAVEEIPDAIPRDAQLARPDLDGLDVLGFLPFPQRASVLFLAQDQGREQALRAMEALLLRAWTALPPGKARCTIIDPVGRGENFSAFMHLADHDESLVSGKIWTEPGHIEQRLTDITTHMETVLQKYLRNQFETLADYNMQAGEVAEAFRFLVVAHFPVNFSAEAARRLVSIATSGARCGVYTFILADPRQPLPHGVNLEDLQAACFDFLWRPPRFLWPDEDFGVFPLTVETPPEPEKCTAILHRVGAMAQRALRVEVPFDRLLPPTSEWWQGDSRQGLSIPLGRAGAMGLLWLNLGEGTSQHVLVAGKTGSGKSTLLHVLIMQLAMRYSPDEVELYLVDFKKGVEFKTYATGALPHARVIAVESEREFGLSVLQKLDAELARRGELFRAAGVTDLAGYRAAADAIRDSTPLPRIVLIVDEFQEFFVEDDKVGQEAGLLLDRLVRQGRAFGMHVLLGSQTLGGAYSLARSTIDQMAVRIALQCSEADGHLILGKDNTEARLLSRPGEAIYNPAGGAIEANHLFQVAWLADGRRDDLLSQVRQRDSQTRPGAVVFEGNVAADLAHNAILQGWLNNHQGQGTLPALCAWLGEAVAIKDPTAAVFRAQSGANLLLLGQQDKAAGHILLSTIIGLGAQLRRAAYGDEAPIQVVVAQHVDEEFETELKRLARHWPVKVVGVRQLPGVLERWNVECERRIAGETSLPRFLILHGLHRLRDLRRDENDFGFAKPGQPLTPHRQFVHLLREGPGVGMHTIVWCDNLANLQRSVDRPDLREFEMRVCFQMSATDSSTLLDSPAASRLGPHRALFFAEDQGKLEKFRPYGLPREPWLSQTLMQPK